MNRLLIIIIGILFLESCQENKKAKNDKEEKQTSNPYDVQSIIFGAYVGESSEPWTITFKVDSSGAYVDTTDSYLHRNDSTFNFKKYPLNKINTLRAQSILNRIPKYLIDKSRQQINCTQCYDAGGTYLEIKTKSEIIRYHTNCETERCSDTLKLLLNQIDSVMYQIIKSENLKWH